MNIQSGLKGKRENGDRMLAAAAAALSYSLKRATLSDDGGRGTKPIIVSNVRTASKSCVCVCP